MLTAIVRMRLAGRIVRVDSQPGHGLARIQDRIIPVRAVRGGPLSVGDRVVVQHAYDGHALVDVRSGGATIGLMPRWRAAAA